MKYLSSAIVLDSSSGLAFDSGTGCADFIGDQFRQFNWVLALFKDDVLGLEGRLVLPSELCPQKC